LLSTLISFLDAFLVRFVLNVSISELIESAFVKARTNLFPLIVADASPTPSFLYAAMDSS
jgi:hypothetical protein